MKHWDEMVRYVQKVAPSYPTLPLVLPDKTFAGDFELQGGGVKAIYLDPSHARESKRKCDDGARNRSQLSCRRRGVQCSMLGGINGLTAIRRAFSYQTEHRLPTVGRPLQRPEAAQ